MKNHIFEFDKRFESSLKITLHSQLNDVCVYKIDLSFNKPTNVKDLTIKWYEPMLGVLSVWTPEFLQRTNARQWFDKNQINSNFYKNAPLICVVDNQKNFSTVALSDAVTPTTIKFFVNDFVEKFNVCFELVLFANVEQTITEYTTYLRIDKTNQAYSQAIKNNTDWLCGFYKRKVDNCDYAQMPLYSSWYAFHQHPDAKTLEEELEIASKLGFKTVILDDGWQYDGLGTGDYYDCGDWAFSKEKFPNAKAFTDKLHDLGMKIAVWFTVPFIGWNSPVYNEYKDKMLYNSDFFRAGIVDPRYPQVRRFLVNVYKDFTLKYGLDGLKLDFIDSFKLLPSSPAYNDDMDTPSVEQAVIWLLDEICLEIGKIVDKPLFEFRQNYVGPAITAYCNMLRVADCAFDSITNRCNTASLRTLSYDLSVHSDMLYWHNKESLLNVKKQLVNVLFSVPQISVLLKNQTPAVLDLIKAHLSYWIQNKNLLLFGEFSATSPELGYSMIESVLDDKAICVTNEYYSYKVKTSKFDLFNNGSQTDFIIICNQEKTATIYNLDYSKIQTLTLKKGANHVVIAQGGMISVE